MSYILNALRKSEKERQAREAPTLENRVLDEYKTHKPWKTWLIAALIAFNLIALLFFFWQSRQNPGSVPSIAAQPEILTQGSSGAHEPAKSGKPPSPDKKKKVVEFPKRKGDGKIEASISERVEKRKSVTAKPIHNKTLEEKVTTLVDVTGKEGLTVLKRSKKQAIASKAGNVGSNKPEKGQNFDSESMVSASSTSVSQEANEQKYAMAKPGPNTAGTIAAKQGNAGETRNSPAASPSKSSRVGNKNRSKKAAPQKAKPDIPFVDELPNEYQRKFPDLNINVYVYSENPDESFIMVDMVKYVPGQKITDGLELKDIHHENMVVEFQGKKVRIRRP